jgi:hypothetical protein
MEKNSWKNFGCCQRYPAFIGNRIGIYCLFQLVEELGLTIEEVMLTFGKSATFGCWLFWMYMELQKNMTTTLSCLNFQNLSIK